MKNNFFIFLLIYLFSINLSLADQFKFKTSEIEFIDNGNIIYAKNGKALSIDGNLEIEAKNFEYIKDDNILKAFSGVAYFKKDNLEIKFDEIFTNQSTLITQAKDNIKIIDKNKQILVETNFISFDKKKNILESNTPSSIRDEFNNILKTENFIYNLNEGVVKLKNVNLKDFNNNLYDIEVAYLNTVKNRLIGKDVVVNLDNKSFNKDNEPRIKGRSVIYENGITEVTKGIFTTCKKNNDCPPWQLLAEKIQHNSKNKTLNYKNALLKVYNVPVMYFPKFFHPDPTVERKSGFLIPTIKNSPTSTNYLSLPYFSVISQNKDLTFTPRFYEKNKILFQTEFRQTNENSSHISDFSFLNEQDKSSKNHFFYQYNKLLNLSNFEDGDFNLKIEKTSNDTYLRSEKLLSPIVNNYNTLENTIEIDLYSSDLSINSKLKVYEDLDKTKNDKYQFVLPQIDIVKKIKNTTNLAGDFFLKSNNYVRSYATNILEKININNLIFNSDPIITKNGFYNDYDFIIKNVNSDAKNSSKYKNQENFYMSGLFQFNSSFPLIKEKNDKLSIIKPRFSLKLSPNNTKDLSNEDGNRLDVDNIYNFDRLSANDTLEGGVSLTLGNDFSIYDKNNTKEIFGIKLANNLRFEENNDLPKNNQIGSKNSNFFGEISLNPNENFSTTYSASTKNNLTDINYENFIAKISLNNFVTTFDYLNENYTLDKSSYLTNTIEYNFNKTNNIKFSTRENKSSNLTEYYNLIYEYKNDCLAASIEYNKDYYNDRDIKPEENIFLKLTIIPFGETSSPNIKD